MNTSEIKKRLTILDKQGNVHVTPSIDVVLITKEPITTIKDHVFSLYREFVSEFGSELSFYSDGDTWKKATGDHSTKLSELLTLNQPLLSYVTHAGSEQQKGASPAPPYFKCYYSDEDDLITGEIRIAFPLEYRPDLVKAFLKKTLIDFPVFYGYGGYGLLFDNEFAWNRSWTKKYAELLKEFPGILFSEDGWFGEIACADEKIAAVNWLTILGTNLIQKMGGKDEIKKHLGEEFEYIDLHQSIGIVAGDTPQLGSKDAHSLPLYQKVGKFLHPITIEAEMIEDMGVAGLENGEDVKWLMRFFTP